MRSCYFDGNAAVDIKSDTPNLRVVESCTEQKLNTRSSRREQGQMLSDRYNSFKGVEITGSHADKLLMRTAIGVGVIALFFFSFFFGA